MLALRVQRPYFYREMALLEVRNLRKTYRTPEGSTTTVLDIPAFDLEPRRQVALSGASGSGKTTFLHLIAGILVPDAGTVRLDDVPFSDLPEGARDRLRATKIGYIFQTFNLLQGYSCLENVLLGMSFGPGPDRARAEALLRRVGLGDRLHHYPRQLSTGQQQRVAVARALANKPRVVLADEPTGNLDHRAGQEALKLIREACHESEAALLLVSHDREVLSEFDNREDLLSLNRASHAREVAS